MTRYPILNNEPDLLKNKTRDGEFKKLKCQTEKHDHEKNLKSFKNDNEYYKKKYSSLNKKKALLNIPEFLIGSGSAFGTSAMALINHSIGVVLTSSTALLTSVANETFSK